jgi:hypothetical protein
MGKRVRRRRRGGVVRRSPPRSISSSYSLLPARLSHSPSSPSLGACTSRRRVSLFFPLINNNPSDSLSPSPNRRDGSTRRTPPHPRPHLHHPSRRNRLSRLDQGASCRASPLPFLPSLNMLTSLATSRNSPPVSDARQEPPEPR